MRKGLKHWRRKRLKTLKSDNMGPINKGKKSGKDAESGKPATTSKPGIKQLGSFLSSPDIICCTYKEVPKLSGHVYQSAPSRPDYRVELLLDKEMSEYLYKHLEDHPALTKIENALKFLEGDRYGGNPPGHFLALLVVTLMSLRIKINTMREYGTPLERAEEQLEKVVYTFKKLEEDPSRTDVDRKEFAEKMRELLYMAKITDSS